MDENAPRSSSSPPDAESTKPAAAATPTKSWSSFAPVPPAPFCQDSGTGSGHSSINGAEAAFLHLNGDIDGDEVEEVDDLDALLFGSTSFLSQEPEQQQHLHFHHHQSTDEVDLDALLYGSTSLLSQAAGRDEEVSTAFQETVKDDSPSSLLFRAINQPRVPLNGRHQNGSSSGSNTQLTQHVFTVTSASPSPPSPLSAEGSKLKPEPGETFKCRKSLSNNHQVHPPEEDDEEHTSSSLQNHKTDDEVPVISSNSLSDSGGVSEEEARISSGPFCSTTSHVPEHTLSDISGPCSSSIVDKVPASFIPGDDGPGAAKITGDKDHQKPLSHQHQPEIKASTSASAATHSEHLRRVKPHELVLHDSTTTSTSSLSDSEEEDNNGCHAMPVLSRSRCGSLKDQDGLPFPPPPPLLLGGEGDEPVPMTVDTCEDYWTRLHDIRINGCILEYMGIGKSIHDNGFAQSSVPLTPLSHYFEITIQDPGEYCYISIGLARKDYNVHKNPGWCRGSIAYHADDGKIFIGGGVGTPFGPRCTGNDVLGCGIIFPDKYGELLEGSSWPWEVTEEKKGEDADIDKSKDKDKDKETSKPRLPSRHNRRKIRVYPMDNFGDVSSESEDDIWWNNKNQVCEDKVKVFFMRNRKLLGIKEVRIPKGGFYPTIGMMSTNERVSVDLHPLTG